METSPTQPNSFPAPKPSFFDSIIFKIGLIGFLTILLVIPSALIQDLIVERQNRQTEVITEIADKWSGQQQISGPVMILPYKKLTKTIEKGVETVNQTPTNIYILPENLKITSTVAPELLHRGIFDAVVYNSKIAVEGNFSPLELKKSGINPNLIDWDNVKLAIGISDLKGLKNNPTIAINNKQFAVEPDFSTIRLFKNNLVITPNLSAAKQTDIPFKFNLDLRGSSELTFLHLGKSTEVKIEGNWNNPSFTGRYLPDSREVTSEKFSAHWKIPFFNRPFPQQWIEENATLSAPLSSVIEPMPRQKYSDSGSVDTETSFGVKFIPTVDQYQQTLRTAKYSFLIILLSFISLFFTEILLKKKVHIIQYILIGGAMTVYYTLLLAFSEQMGFDLAYLIASVSTISLIASFLYLLFKSVKPALIFATILSIFYVFIYAIIQLQDMAVLVGSIGLFITVAVLMFFSAKQDWFKG